MNLIMLVSLKLYCFSPFLMYQSIDTVVSLLKVNRILMEINIILHFTSEGSALLRIPVSGQQQLLERVRTFLQLFLTVLYKMSTTMISLYSYHSWVCHLLVLIRQIVFMSPWSLAALPIFLAFSIPADISSTPSALLFHTVFNASLTSSSIEGETYVR